MLSHEQTLYISCPCVCWTGACPREALDGYPGRPSLVNVRVAYEVEGQKFLPYLHFYMKPPQDSKHYMTV